MLALLCVDRDALRLWTSCLLEYLQTRVKCKCSERATVLHHRVLNAREFKVKSGFRATLMVDLHTGAFLRDRNTVEAVQGMSAVLLSSGCSCSCPGSGSRGARRHIFPLSDSFSTAALRLSACTPAFGTSRPASELCSSRHRSLTSLRASDRDAGQLSKAALSSCRLLLAQALCKRSEHALQT